ncbi:MAG: prolipoprotein diacylglyceryl transferase, partial [Paludibacteraceae bacterium]|nr:prolipoprotein diacylglyceryl transferase [Paludibacteraceae bacterium]
MFPSVSFLGLGLYSWGHILAGTIGLLFSIWYAKKCRTSLEKAFLLVAWIIPSIFLTMHIVSLVDGAYWSKGSKASIFMPAIICLLCTVLNLPFTKVLDFLIPCFTLAIGIAKIFCIFPGCCRGYPCSFGIWNEIYHAYLFPIQLFESATYLLIFWYMISYAKKKNYETHGISYGQYLFLFGLAQTFLDFFRDDTPQRWQISTFQYYSFAAFLIGLIWLGVAFYLQKNPEFVKKHELLFRED